ncbi:MAG: glycoside hydrolase family 3 C-terminal domain-containing protein [Ferruginibacter sp.]
MKNNYFLKLTARLLVLLMAVPMLSVAQNDLFKAETEIKINELIRQMSLAEKVNMIHASSPFTSGGVARLGIPEFITSDGPHGVRAEHGRDWELDNNIPDSGTYLPVGVCLAATWNKELGYEFGRVLGSEANYRGKDIILGPGINIIRSPLNGRNFEYLSEDPILVSKMAVGSIKGIQDQGISCCVKHFVANNQETRRNTIDVQMSERALREIYLPGFKAAVQLGGANTVMSAYNKFRGQWASHSHYLLNSILKKEWDFKGVVISDWNAVHATPEPLWNGLDLEMGTDLSMMQNRQYNKFYMADPAIKLVNEGKIPEYLIDDKVRRLLRVMYKTNMLGDLKRIQGEYNTTAHRQTALQIAEEGIVLLKNENNFLPLNKKQKRTIAVIGFNADRKQSLGGGSSQVRAFYEITPLAGLQNIVGKNVTINYEPGYEVKRNGGANTELMNRAVAIASKADMVIYVGGSFHGYTHDNWSDNAYDAEDTDKPDMMLPFGQDELIKAILAVNPKMVVVMVGGGAMDMRLWINETPAIIQSWYAGMEGGRALARIIFGDVNPSGKLPMTFPKKLEDHPSQAMGEFPYDTSGLAVHYYDDIYVGYRYYDTWKVVPEFAFGHGLSYTNFEYSNLNILNENAKVTISFTIKNTGKLAGAEIAQVYVKPYQSVLPRPEKELKEFDKVYLEPGAFKTVTLQLTNDDFSYFDDLKNTWVMDPGKYGILVGASSRDIKLSGMLSR